MTGIFERGFGFQQRACDGRQRLDDTVIEDETWRGAPCA